MNRRQSTAGGLGVIAIVLLALLLRELGGPDLLSGHDPNTPAGNPPPANIAPRSEDARLEQLFRDQASDVMVTLSGTVDRTLPDDNDGSRHQRFILRLDSGRTVLVAHNIDLAHRVPLNENDRVTIRGEYEWSSQGGTVHWTHHDPKQWREGGWIDHDGTRYQ